MAEVVLALDVGTSSCRASLYDVGGRRLGRVGRSHYTLSTTPDGGAELDPDLLLRHVAATVDAVVQDSRQTILAVATSTFWHSLLGLDRAGQPLTPIFTWADARSRDDAAALSQTLDPTAVHARTGRRLHSSYWPARLRWLRRTQPDTAARVATWVSFGDYLRLQLSGRLGVSTSMASGTGLLDQHTCAWDAPLLHALALDPATLAPLVHMTDAGASLPHAAERWPALQDAEWLPAVGDGAASNLGAAHGPDRFALMVGTSGAERAVWQPAAAFSIPPGTWCYRVDERRLVLGGALNDGGNLFGWLRRTLRLPSIAEAESELATLLPTAHGLTVLPFWAGERSPGWAADARGSIVGLRLHTRPIDILRAALEAVALRFGELDRLLRQALPNGGQRVVATGGALLRSPAWLQILADVLGRPVLVSSELEASSRGAALLAWESLGRLARPLDADPLPIRATVEPNLAHTTAYAAAADRQRHLYDLLVRDAP